MTKFVRSLALAAGMAALLIAGGASVAPAQDKKDAKGTKGGKSTAAGTVEIKEGKDGKFRFNVHDADGKYLGGTAVGYESKEAALKVLDTLKDVLPNAKVVNVKKDDKGKEKDEKGKEKFKDKSDK